MQSTINAGIKKLVRAIINEQEISALRLWWNGLDDDWQKVLKAHVKVNEQPTDDDLIKMAGLTSISLKDFDTNNLNPVTMMPNLKKLDISNTSINDFEPLRNAKNLEELDITYTLAPDFDPLNDLKLKVLHCKKVRVPYEQIKQYAISNPQCRIYWDLDGDQHWLDGVGGTEDNIKQKYIKEYMARELSPLQKRYADFFFSMLDTYEVETPAKLSDEKKTEFFNQIKKDWKKEKKALAKDGIHPVAEDLSIKEKATIAEHVIKTKTKARKAIASYVREHVSKNEKINEANSPNPEGDKLVKNFIAKLVKEWDIKPEEVVWFITASFKRLGYK